MITTFHVRGAAREDVVAAVTKQMEAEGYVLDPAAEEAPGRGFGVPAVRGIDIVTGEGWVSLVDHPFARTPWASLLSGEIPLPIVELAGECDHAFYSTAILYEGGEERGASRVPEDAVLEDDGRHRIRPLFLAAVAPAARAALEAGIAVDRHGGEGNVVAVGAALGIPRPLVRPDWDQQPELRLVFRRVREVEQAPMEGLDLGAILGRLTEKLGGAELAELAALMSTEPDVADLPRLFVQLAQSGQSAGSADGALEVRVSLSSQLTAARGITIELGGAGVGLLDLPTTASLWFAGESSAITAEREGDVLRFHADVALQGAARPMPFGALNLAIVPGNDRAEAIVRIPSALPRPGRGHVVATVRTREPDDVFVQESLEIVVGGQLRMPVLPKAVTLLPHMHEEYAARTHLRGWVGFGANWSDVASRVTPMLQDLVATLRKTMGFALDEVSFLTGEFEELVFPTTLAKRDATWSKIEAALMRGGVLRIDAMTEGCTIDGAPRPEVSIELTHNRDGGFFGGAAKNVDGEPIDRPRVTLAWTLTRPETAEGRALVAEISRRILLDAGHVAGQLGGFVSSNGTVYEHFAGTSRLAETQEWLAAHVRTPAWCVLAPSAAATKLATPKNDRIRTTRTTHGLFAWSTARDPFAYADADAEAMERFVLPAIAG